jgi:hypothetical protein
MTQSRTQPQFAVPVNEYWLSPQSQNFQVMVPPNVWLHPDTNHSHPR